MLKQSVVYTDFNGVEQSETLYFNITKTEMVDLIDLMPRLENFSNTIEMEEPRELTVPEIREILDIIKILIDKSYGERSEDGKHFRKSPQILDDFKSSAAYDKFLFGMFENVAQAVNFMVGVVPKELADDPGVKDAIARGKMIEEVTLPEEAKDLNATDVEVPAWIREDRDPTQAELTSMSTEELRIAFQRKTERRSQQSTE